MKKLTLGQAWVLCLRQWKWIIKQLDAGSEKVVVLKADWIEAHGYSYDEVTDNCFFCEYADEQNTSLMGSIKETRCPHCSGRQVSSRFSCLSKTYNYEYKPRKFYAKLLELNEKRKAKK